MYGCGRRHLSGDDVMDEFQSGLYALGLLVTLSDILFFPFSLLFGLLSRLLFHPHP